MTSHLTSSHYHGKARHDSIKITIVSLTPPQNHVVLPTLVWRYGTRQNPIPTGPTLNLEHTFHPYHTRITRKKTVPQIHSTPLPPFSVAIIDRRPMMSYVVSRVADQGWSTQLLCYFSVQGKVVNLESAGLIIALHYVLNPISDLLWCPWWLCVKGKGFPGAAMQPFKTT